jgi:hypothetical protein
MSQNKIDKPSSSFQKIPNLPERQESKTTEYSIVKNFKMETSKDGNFEIRIPMEGWFFEIGETTSSTRVWHNGEKIRNVRKVTIELSADDMIPKVTVEVLMSSGQAWFKNENVELIGKYLEDGQEGKEEKGK